jgi:hypothetical protein
MAKLVLTGAFVSIGGTDLSDHVRSISLECSADIQDATCMTDTWKTKLAGLKDWKASLEMAQDYANSSVDDVLFAALGVSTALIFRPTQAVAGADNPEYTGNGFLSGYNPLDGKVGELGGCKPTFEGTGALGRAEA